MRRLFVFLLIFTSKIVLAQSNFSTEVISSENVHRLQSITQIDFESMNCSFGTGNFVMSQTGNYFAAKDNRNHIYVWTGSGDLLYQDDFPCDVVRDVGAMAFDENDFLYIFEQGNSNLDITRFNFQDNFSLETATIPFEGLLLSAWIQDDTVWMEVRQDNTETIISIHELFSSEIEIQVILYAIANDPLAIVRVGRIPQPYTVTSSRDGIVKLWDIATGEIVYEVDNGTGTASVFGAINQSATHFVWRDSPNESLYLLNFETGENRLLDSLNGDYAQWYFLSPDVSLAIAVNLGFEPNIVVWDTITGERQNLGAYRQCNRPQPDMAQLSVDGTTLVIGCDTGLDIWRIKSGNE